MSSEWNRRFRQLVQNRFLQNIGWLSGAELIQRVSRLAATVILARTFTAYDYGMVSVIYTVLGFVHVFSMRAGIGARIVQAPPESLATIASTAYWLNWIFCGAVFLLQCVAAYPIALFYGNLGLVLPICGAASIYLMFPLFLVQAALIERENRLHITALCSAVQAILANVILSLLAIAGWGVWSVVWSMWLSYGVWIVIMRSQHSWRAPREFRLERSREILAFGSKVLGVELLNTLRLNIDYLLVGRVLGLEALGRYFFAFNAGLGISQSVLNSLTLAWYPYFCEVRTDMQQLKRRFFNSLKSIATLVVPLVLAQTILAPVYVPIIFGNQWVDEIPILMMICFSAIPIALSRANSQLLQAVDQTHLDLYWNAGFTVVFTVAVWIGVQSGIQSVAIAVLLSQAIAMPLLTLWVIRRIFKQ